MAKIVSFVVCESINNMPSTNVGVVPNLINPQVVLRPQYIPGNFSFGIAVGVVGIDLKVPNKIRFTISNTDGIVIQNSGENDLPVVREEDTIPNEFQGFMMCMDIRNLVLHNEGEYSFTLYLNGESVGMKSIPIFKQVI